MAKAKAQPTEYITLDEVLARLNVSREVHFQSAALPNYPQAKYEGTVLLGYSRSDVENYLKNSLGSKAEPLFEAANVMPEPIVDTAPVEPVAELTALVAEALPEDEHITRRTIEVPIGDLFLSRSNTVANSHSANWSEPDKLRWRKILVGLIRQEAKYLDVRAPAGNQMKLVRTIAGAQLWMIQQLAPLSLEEIESIHWQKRMKAEA